MRVDMSVDTASTSACATGVARTFVFAASAILPTPRRAQEKFWKNVRFADGSQKLSDIGHSCLRQVS
jgi:hypothetical protein